MRTVNGGGDQLARGATRVQFKPAETTEEKWNDAFADFDPEKFKREGMPKVEGVAKEYKK
jgi:hypothetical protein